jgi:uncharacterized protein YkwD
MRIKKNLRFKSFIFGNYLIFLFILSALIISASPLPVYAGGSSPDNIIHLTNKERERAGLIKLSPNAALTEAAANKADEIFRTNNFQHTINDKKFSAWIKETGYDYQYAGENLAINYFKDNEAMTAWMNSVSHKKNILNPLFEEIGVAIVEGPFDGADAKLIVQEFGTKVKDKTQSYQIASSGSVSLSPNSNFYMLTTSVDPRGLLASPYADLLVAGSSFQSKIAMPNTFLTQRIENTGKKDFQSNNLSAFCYILALGYSYKISRKNTAQ